MNEPQTENFLWRTFRGSRDALLQRAMDEPDLTWRVLATVSGFRLFVAALLLVLIFAWGEPRIFGDSLPLLFVATAAGVRENNDCNDIDQHLGQRNHVDSAPALSEHDGGYGGENEI
ncbi:MAG: hypothetical protein WBN44_02875, partial [Woeseiaceae bacterium]